MRRSSKFMNTRTNKRSQSMKFVARTKIVGFTLIELMIVVAIVAVLAAIAYPSYKDSVHKSHRSDALQTLSKLSQILERCYSQNFSYAGCTSLPSSPTKSPNGYYSVTIASAATTYTLTATPINSQASDTTCSTIQLTNAGQSSKDGGGTTNTVTCWGGN